MTRLQLLGYISDAWVLATYAWLVHRAKPLPFHWANALGAAPLLIAEVQLGAWQVLPLTGAFCALGWLGLYKTWRAKRSRDKLTVELQGIVHRQIFDMPVHISPYVPKGQAFLINRDQMFWDPHTLDVMHDFFDGGDL